MSGAVQSFDSDEDLDLTDTKLLSHSDDDDDNDDEELKKYIDIPGLVAKKDLPEVLSDTDSDVVEIDLNSQPSFHNDPPDYESPSEDEKVDWEHSSGFHDYNQDSPEDDMGYDELLKMCEEGRDVDNKTEYDQDDDYISGNTPGKTKTHFKRKSPYIVTNRNYPVNGKGKQPVSGTSRLKSSRSRRSLSGGNDTDQNLLCIDSARPICFGDGPGDLSKVEDIPVIPAPPLLCEACEKETSHNSMVQCCDGHMVCMRCVETSAKRVLVGEMKGSVECPYTSCTSSVPLSELRKALPAIVLDLLEDKWNKETMEALENMKDAVKCPGCNFPAVLDLAMKRFQCVQCNEAYCRFCDKKWTERKKHDLCIKTKQWTSPFTGNIVNIPAEWSDTDTDAMDGKTESHTLIELEPSSAEFCDVVHFMNKNMNSTVKKIFRVQNERLWEKYSLSKSHMVADLGELNINEKRLFHGTHSDVIEAICKEGFDWRLCGKHGTVYGQGTYFAKSPMLSHSYSSGRISRRARVCSRGTGAVTGFLFGSSRPPSHLRPPLRFGAPTTAQSGFTIGGQPINSNNSTFDNGRNIVGQTGRLAFGVQQSGTSQTPRSTLLFGLVSTPSSVTGSTHQTTSANSGSDYVFRPYKYVSLLPQPNCFQSSQGQSCAFSKTSTDPSSSIKTSCSNCIFCSSKRKSNDSTSTTTIASQSTTSNFISTGVGNAGAGKATSGAQFLIKAFPASVLNKGSSDKTLTFGGGSATSAFWPDRTSGSGFQPGGNGSNFNLTGQCSSGSFGNHGRSNLDIDESNDYFMFLARVLVGRSCLGSHEMRRPHKDRNGETHSAVDNQSKPKIYVIFDNNQCYPEYVIQYSTSPTS